MFTNQIDLNLDSEAFTARYGRRKTVATYTLGCKVNQYETAALEKLFTDADFEIADFKEIADIYVINTCTVTNLGQKKSRQMIRRAIQHNADAIIIVTGCYAQTAPGEVMEIFGVDLVIGTQDRPNILQYIRKIVEERRPINAVSAIWEQKEFEDMGAPFFGERTRATLKIQEGCTEFCSYCIIPYARGKIRSRKMSSILEQAKLIVDQGYKEIVLAGIHLGAYGRDMEGVELADVLEALQDVTGLERIRISSIEATEVNERILRLMQNSSKFCNHLHLPLQAASDEILQKMNRKYTTEQYRRIVENIRKRLPNIAITTDLIVGFPGETDELFMDGYRFIESMDFADMHVFKYSKRSGTPAATMESQILNAVKEQRSHMLIELNAEKKRQYHEKFLGAVVPVIVEQKCKDQSPLLDVTLSDITRGSGTRLSEPDSSIRQEWYEGHGDNYMKLVFPAPENIIGTVQRILVKQAGSDYSLGVIVD